MATEVGNQLQAATNEQTVQQSAVAQAQNLVEQYSGVNLDEEASKLLQYQQQYQAAAQMIQAANTVFNALITDLNAVP